MSPAARSAPEAQAQPDGDVGGTPPRGHPERGTLAAGYGPGTRRLRACVGPSPAGPGPGWHVCTRRLFQG